MIDVIDIEELIFDDDEEPSQVAKLLIRAGDRVVEFFVFLPSLDTEFTSLLVDVFDLVLEIAETGRKSSSISILL